jgi:hypothetical protein
VADVEREYLVRILLIAREQITRVVQQATDAVNQLTGAQEKSTEQSRKSSDALRSEAGALEQLREARVREKRDLDDSTISKRAAAGESQKHADALRKEAGAAREVQRAHAEQARTLLQEARSRQDLTGKVDAQTRSYTRQATEQRRLAQEQGRIATSLDKEALAHERRARASESDARRTERASSALSRSIQESSERIRTLHRDADRLATLRGRVRGFLNDVRDGARDSDVSLARLAASFRGFQIAFVIKYAQALISALAGLAGALLAVAGNAVQAGIGLAAGLAAGAAQALPVVALLTTALLRVASVMKAVKLANDQQLVSTRDQEQAAERQRNASEAIRSAREREADANRSVADAQRELNEARADGRRQLEDLMDAERGAVLTLDEARAALRQAVATGDAGAVARAQLDVSSARRGLGRAREDRLAIGGQVERLPAFEQASRRLEEAERGAKQAVKATADARRDAVEAVDQQTAALDRLDAMIEQMSPVEQRLYRSILNFQSIFKQVFRPITDIILEPFVRGVDRASALLRDPVLIGNARRLAGGIAESLNAGIREGLGGRSLGFVNTLTKEATRNLPQITRIIVNLFRTARNLIEAALPAFRLLLDYVEDYSKKARDASEDTESISRVFVDGVKYAKAWFDLALAAVDLFAALTGAGGAEAGFEIVKDATKSLHDLADQVRANRDGVKEFFDDSRFVFDQVVGVLVNLARAIADVFSTRNIGTFADFLNHVVIPALATTVEMMGFLTSVAHALLSVPIIRDIAQWAATFLLLAKGLVILRGAVIALQAILYTFVGTFGLIPALVLAAVAAIVLLDKRFHFLAPTFKFIRRVAEDVFEWLKTAAVDVFNAVKGPARDVIDWFKDVWNQGLLKWIRAPFIWLAENVSFPVWRRIIRAAGDVIDFFGKGSVWSTIADVIAAPFKVMWRVIKPFFDVVKEGIAIFLDAIAGRFDRIGGRIANIWYRIFSTLHAVMVDVINTIADGVNTAIGAFNALPGPNIGKLDINLKKMPVSRIAAETLELAKQGKTSSSYGSGALADRRAEGGPVRAKPGGRLVLAAEAGFDEVVLTTDPKHAPRQKMLLMDYLSKMAPHFADGGWVQGARPTPPSSPVTALANFLFRRGFFATSGYRSTSTTYHGQGQAVDFGDSVNNLRSLWRVVFPLRRALAELGGPTYVSGGRWFRNGDPQDIQGSALQQQHENHIHIAMATRIQQIARRVGSALGGNVGAIVEGATRLPAILRRSVRELIGQNPRGRVGGFASGALGSIYERAADTIRELRREGRARLTGAVDAGTDLSGISGSVARQVYQVGRRMSAPFKHLLASMMIGLVESGMRNLSYGDADSVGWRQERVSIYGPSARNVLASARRVFQEMRQFDRGQSAGELAADVQRPAAQYRGRYAEAYERALALLRSVQRGGRFMFGGAVPGYGGGDVNPRWLEGGEHVLTKEEVQAAGGHDVILAMRRMLGGGGQGGPDGFQRGGEVLQIGDSLSVGIQRYLRRLVEGLVSDTRVGRGSDEALRVLKDKLRKSYQEVIFDVGTNDAQVQTLKRNLKRAHRLLSEDQELIVSTVRGPGAAAKNRFLRRFAAQNEDVNLVNTLGIPTGPDDIHLDDAGYRRRARLFARAIRRARASGTDEQGGDRVSNTIAGMVELIDRIANALQKGRGTARKLRLAFERIFEEGGPLERLRAETEAISERVQARLQRAQFIVGRGGGVRRAELSATQVARREFGGLQRQRVGFTREASALDELLGTAQAELGEARARDDDKAIQQAKAEIARIRQRQRDVNRLLVQNAQDLVEKQEEIQQAQADAVEASITDRNRQLDLFERGLTALGVAFNPISFIDARITIMRDQISGLSGVLARAQSTGNAELARQIREKIDELNVAIAEAVAQRFQAQIDAVNFEATAGLTAVGRRQRLAQVGGTNFTAIRSALFDERSILLTQQARLDELARIAESQGNLAQASNLREQLADLAVTIVENTQAIQDNTDSATADRISRINEAAGFTTGVFGSATTFFQGLASLTGQQQVGPLLAAAQGTGQALQTQRRGLIGELTKLIGFGPGSEAQGTDLVNFLLSVASGPIFDSIMTRLNPTQEAQFRDLVNGLLGNTNAIQDNTKAVQDLTNSTNIQDWNSTLWQRFREAVFNGIGGVLPQYQIPGLGFSSPGVAMASAPTGASSSVSWGGVQMTNHFVRTDPNPLEIARTLEWSRKQQT